MANAFPGNNTEGEFEVYSGSEMGHAVDMLVGTPARLLEMTRGSGWDKELVEGKGTRRKSRLVGRPEVGLSDVEWVIVDEADILFGALASQSIHRDLF
jgi:ATP-dependent RNA helicase MRH4